MLFFSGSKHRKFLSTPSARRATVTPEGIEALRKKYPRAAAYRKAEAGSLAANYVQASAYEKALERIINGDDYEKALVDADAEWKAYLDEHIWD